MREESNPKRNRAWRRKNFFAKELQKKQQGRTEKPGVEYHRERLSVRDLKKYEEQE